MNSHFLLKWMTAPLESPILLFSLLLRNMGIIGFLELKAFFILLHHHHNLNFKPEHQEERFLGGKIKILTFQFFRWMICLLFRFLNYLVSPSQPEARVSCSALRSLLSTLLQLICVVYAGPECIELLIFIIIQFQRFFALPRALPLTSQCGQKGGIFPFCGIFGPKGGTDF